MSLPSHLSARELAALALPGLPGTKRGINLRASSDGWATVSRAGRRLIDVSSLPEQARAALLARSAKLMPSPKPVADNDQRRAVGRPKGTGHFDRHPNQARAIRAWLTQRDLSAARIAELLAVEFADLPSDRSLRRFIQQFRADAPVLIASFTDPERARGKYLISLGRKDAVASYAHEAWELDTTPADVMTTEGRCAILGVIDIWSRRVRFMVAPSESAHSVRQLLISTIAAWGVMPARVVTDQGSGYINGSIVSALGLLGIQHDPCLRASPQDKPHIERVFGTFTRSRAVLLPGFVGHNVAQAQRIRAQARKETGRPVIEASISPAELQAALDAWVDGTYHQRAHSSLGMSPMARWLSSPRPAAAAPTSEQLAIALSALIGTRTVGKRGLQWRNAYYWCDELVPFVGRQVTLRRNEDDLGKLLVFDAGGIFVGVAVDHERSGLSERARSVAARTEQRVRLSEARAAIRADQRAHPLGVSIEKLLAAEAEAASKVVSLRRPTEQRTTAQLDSMVAPREAPAPRDADLARADRALSPPAPPPAPSVAEKVADTDAVLSAHAAGAAIEPDRLRRAQAYAQSHEYRTEKLLTASFARPAPSARHDALPPHLKGLTA